MILLMNVYSISWIQGNHCIIITLAHKLELLVLSLYTSVPL